MFLYCFFFFILMVNGSHYRGGTISYTFLSFVSNGINNDQVRVQISQRHSWSYVTHPCTNINEDFIGEGTLTTNGQYSGNSTNSSLIDARVQCTDFSRELDYSTGENSIDVILPINKTIEYFYQSCCWISLLPPDSSSNWALKVRINTNKRADGSLNNSPRTAMSPVVQVGINEIHHIRIPMADTDGDQVRCRWGNSSDECGGVCQPKGHLISDPCQLTYNATQLGYQAVALVIEDFDTNNNVLSSIPLQFLIHVVNQTATCSEYPTYIGDWPADSCIGVQSNETMTARIQIRLPCNDSSITLSNILTVSPVGLTKGAIIRDKNDSTLYSMNIEWTPRSDQYGIQQFCLTPVDSRRRTGSQICLTFQVDILPPQFESFFPSDFVLSNQSLWKITFDRDIVKSKRDNQIFVRFYQRSNNNLVYQIDINNDSSVQYTQREIIFSTKNFIWNQGEEYYILFDSGIATINESCGVESIAMNNHHFWVFRVITPQTTSTTTLTTTLTTTTTTTATTTSLVLPSCPRWFSFKRISNESTNENQTEFVFCFKVESEISDVTISANTWVPCPSWKSSGAADPFLQLYSLTENQLLAENDDGNNSAFQNCFAAVLSYRLKRGDYRVVVQNPKCAFGYFELRLVADQLQK